jgi:hypothetical protein
MLPHGSRKNASRALMSSISNASLTMSTPRLRSSASVSSTLGPLRLIRKAARLQAPRHAAERGRDRAHPSPWCARSAPDSRAGLTRAARRACAGLSTRSARESRITRLGAARLRPLPVRAAQRGRDPALGRPDEVPPLPGSPAISRLVRSTTRVRSCFLVPAAGVVRQALGDCSAPGPHGANATCASCVCATPAPSCPTGARGRRGVSGARAPRRVVADVLLPWLLQAVTAVRLSLLSCMDVTAT